MKRWHKYLEASSPVIGQFDIKELKSSKGNDDTIFKALHVEKDSLKDQENWFREEVKSADELESDAKARLQVVEHIQKYIKSGSFEKIERNMPKLEKVYASFE
eukprot:Platyproteum_vivax@DN1044_c0_g1_i2.p1